MPDVAFSETARADTMATASAVMAPASAQAVQVVDRSRHDTHSVPGVEPSERAIATTHGAAENAPSDGMPASPASATDEPEPHDSGAAHDKEDRGASSSATSEAEATEVHEQPETTLEDDVPSPLESGDDTLPDPAAEMQTGIPAEADPDKPAIEDVATKLSEEPDKSDLSADATPPDDARDDNSEDSVKNDDTTTNVLKTAALEREPEAVTSDNNETSTPRNPDTRDAIETPTIVEAEPPISVPEAKPRTHNKIAETELHAPSEKYPELEPQSPAQGATLQTEQLVDSERVDPDLEAALGDMFASPPELIDRRAPLGVPGDSFSMPPRDEPMQRYSTVAVPDDDIERFEDVRSGAINRKAAVSSIHPTPDSRSQTQFTHSSYASAPQYASLGQGHVDQDGWRQTGANQTGAGEAGPGQTGFTAHELGQARDPSFSTSDQIAPDPALERSHIDTRIDVPFATDFTDNSVPPHPMERRGRHVHADLNRRRATVNLGWFCLAALLGSFIGIVTLARETVVRTLPGAADFYSAIGHPVNIRGLDFENVSYDWTTDGGRPAIDVKGTIRNVSAIAMEVPTVVFVLLDDRGDELYNWASRVRDTPIEAGGQAMFEARVPAPPKAARRLRVRFARKSR